MGKTLDTLFSCGHTSRTRTIPTVGRNPKRRRRSKKREKLIEFSIFFLDFFIFGSERFEISRRIILSSGADVGGIRIVWGATMCDFESFII